MLEAGLSLIAASLPTLSYLITRHSLQSALQRVRSSFPLYPMRSTRSSDDTVAFGRKVEGSYAQIRGNNAKTPKSHDWNSQELDDLNQEMHTKHEIVMTDDMV